MSENVTINLNEPKENITISLVDQGEEIIIKLNEQARGPSVVVDNAVVNAAIAEDPQATRDALEIPIDNFTATNEPTVSDDSSEGYQKGSRWYDTVAEEAYICVDASVGAAIWIKTTLTVDELGSAAFLDATTDGAANPEEVLKTDANGDVTVHNINVGSVLFDTANGTPDTLGELGWDSEDETLAFVMKSGEVLQIGEETLYHIENNTVSTIAKGTPVMYAGTIGNSGKLRGKPWDGTVPKAFLGIASAPILGNGGTGYVTHFGKVKGIQTNGANYGETWVSGDIIYAVSGSSNLTKVQPSAGGYVVVAVVIAAHASNGTLFVRPTEVPSLTDIGAAATLHTHGNITSDGRIGSTATLPIITTTGGTLTTGAFGTTAGTFAQGNDARLSDERVPTAAGIASKINGATAKTTLVDADETVLTDSAASFGLKKVTWANVFAYILTKIQAAASIVFTGQLRSSNQTAATADALMTRSLSGIESFYNLGNVFRVLATPSFANSGTAGVASGTAAGDRWINLGSGTANSGWARATIGRGITSSTPISGVGIAFGRAQGVAIVGYIGLVSFTDALNIFRIRYGSDGTPTADGVDAVSYRGFGLELKARGSSHDWRIYGHNGTSINYSAWTNTGLSVDILSTRLYLSVISDGAGNITGSLGSLGSRTLSQITTTGGPTTSGGSTQALIDIHVANSASGTSSLTANFYDAIYYAL
jgi:hypothetical protein